jgi:hypothetical protein
MELFYSKGVLRFCEVWFNEGVLSGGLEDQHENVDVIVFHESRVPVSIKSIPFRNGIVVLETDSDKLFGMFNSGFRNEVRRAWKESIVTGSCTLVHCVDSFYPIYAQFCLNKQIAALPHALLEHYASSAHLFISIASQRGVAIQAHLYMVVTNEAILLASFPMSTNFPSKVAGWANRALHWADILQFKELGLLWYNLGGMGNPVTERNKAIVAFKSEMNPIEKIYYQDAVPVSQLGKFYFIAKKFFK